LKQPESPQNKLLLPKQRGLQQFQLQPRRRPRQLLLQLLLQLLQSK
jgi:hypothetical protein